MADAQMLGPYRLERVLGTGSFATVWLAHDQVLDRRVAVKILADNWSRDHEVRRRFLSEARVLLTAESSRIVRGFHLGETEGGQPYLVMAWADRGTLGDRIEQRRREGRNFDVMEVVSVATEIAYALHDVHASGHLHRDVKPTNVLVRSSSTRRDIPGLAGDETVVLADFGLARGLDMTSLTLVAGSPGYVSPEQAAGLSQLDRRADLYSLGRIMLELLTGDPGGNATTMAAAASERIDVPAAIGAAVEAGMPEPPARLVDLVSRLLAEQPDDRPSTADEVAAELVALRASMSVPGGVRGGPLAPPSAAPPADFGHDGLPQPTGTQLAAPAPPRTRLTSRAKLVLGATAVVLAAIIALVIALPRGGGGEANDSTTTDPPSRTDPVVPVDSVDPVVSAANSTDPAVVASTGVPLSEPVGTGPDTITTDPNTTDPNTTDPSTTDSPGGPSTLGIDPTAAGRLDLSGFNARLAGDDDDRTEVTFAGPVSPALAALLEANPGWELVGDPPAEVGHERVTVTLTGPTGEARVRLAPIAETALQGDDALTEIVVTYD